MLLLASNSKSRKNLLTKSGIPFIEIGHNADEDSVDKTLTLNQQVAAIAQLKMEYAQLPIGQEGQTIFVLTADTMGQDNQGVIHGKPKDYADAVAKIKALSKLQDYTTSTGFCVTQQQYRNGAWHVIETVSNVVSATYQFSIPEQWIEKYIAQGSVLTCSGAIEIEGYGQQFLKTVNGSYSTIEGLPLFEVRQALEVIGFFN
jgi:septum formation protein